MHAWCMVVIGHSTVNYGLSGIFFSFTVEVWTPYFICGVFYLQDYRHPCSINYQVLAGGTKREKKRRNIITPVLTKKIYLNLKTSKYDLVILI